MPPKSSVSPPASPCPCGRPLSYADCCGRYHAGTAAPNAEDLMRSRYSAYVLALESYLLATWHASTRPPTLDLADDHATRWLGLEIRHCAPPGETPPSIGQGNTAFVEFVARYKTAGRAHRLHEVSRFLNEEGRWYYVDGEIKAAGQKAGLKPGQQ